MNTVYLPYYISRALLVTLFCFTTMGITMQSILIAIAILMLFVLALHSGWFPVDLSKPFFPLRRDEFGLDIQRKSLISAVWVTILFSFLLNLSPRVLSAFPFLDVNILGLGVIVYFMSQLFHFLKLRLGKSGSV